MLDKIQTTIHAELERYVAIFRAALLSDVPTLSGEHNGLQQSELLVAALSHLTRRLGKMMRPTLVLLCAREGGHITDEVLHAAAGLEMLHTASLIHDDVVDESAMRRGQRSVNALFDNKAAVLVGDYVTSKALTEMSLSHSLDVVSRMAWLGQTLADGELEQLSATQLTTFDEAPYYKIIAKKTASLFSTCAYAGALLGGASSDTVATLEQYGHLVGLCFQMRDDIFDFDESLNVGKPKGNDMQEGKLTLPVLYAVANSDDYHRRLALKVRAHEASRLEIQELVDFTLHHGGVEYATGEMHRLRDEAARLLSTLHDTAVAEALRMYIDFVVEREK